MRKCLLYFIFFTSKISFENGLMSETATLNYQIWLMLTFRWAIITYTGCVSSSVKKALVTPLLKKIHPQSRSQACLQFPFRFQRVRACCALEIIKPSGCYKSTWTPLIGIPPSTWYRDCSGESVQWHSAFSRPTEGCLSGLVRSLCRLRHNRP